MAKFVFERIVDKVNESKCYGVILDETSDISKTEQVSICLRYIFEGDIKAFIGFLNTMSTSGEDIFNLVKKEFRMMVLQFIDIVAKCFDSPSNECYSQRSCY